tara:strand:+ start:111 stop:461 length:351 start_codon:yes stop_codon:yes gene_type:complete
MDLLKMNPMARKLTVHTDAFNKALESSDPFAAQQHLNEIMKFAGYLNDDIHTAVKKAEELVDVVQPGESTIIKMNQSGQKFDVSQRSAVLPGVIVSARVGNGSRKHYGTFGRYSPK